MRYSNNHKDGIFEDIFCLVIPRNIVIPRNVDVSPFKLVGYNTECVTMRCYTTECRICVDICYITELQIFNFITRNVDYIYIRLRMLFKIHLTIFT